MKGFQPELRRTLGLTQVVLYGVGLILGAGIYVIIGDVAAISGNAIWISFILAAVIASFTGLSYAELASMFPKSARRIHICKTCVRDKFYRLICRMFDYFCSNHLCCHSSNWLFRLPFSFFPASIINCICSNTDNNSINCEFLWYKRISLDKLYLHTSGSIRTCNNHNGRIPDWFRT